MKKIVGILAGAAVLASSVFAADISAGARLEGDLFNYDGVSEQAKAIMIKGANNPWNAPATFSVSSDNAGATWKFTDKGANHALETSNYQIWFKPVDVVTVKVGNIAESMNTETIEWTGRVKNYDSFGYEAVYAQDALTIALAFVPGEGNYWFASNTGSKDKTVKAAKEAVTKAETAEADALGKKDATDPETVIAYNAAVKATKAAKEALAKAEADDTTTYDPTIKELNVYASYAADFGTICAMLDFDNGFKKDTFAVGYKNTFDALTVFADVAAVITTDDENPKDKGKKNLTNVGMIIDAFAQYNIDAFTAKAYVKATMTRLTNLDKDYCGTDWDGNAWTPFSWVALNKDGKLDNAFQLMLKLRADYKLDPVNVFAQFVSNNLLEKQYKAEQTEKAPSSVFVSTIKAGLNGSVGICNWECAAQIDTGKGAKYDKVNFSVPVNFSVNF